MILHARFEGVHAALIHSPCLTRSLMLDERLAHSYPCIIIITFFLTLYRCLFFHKFSSLSRSDHVKTIASMRGAWNFLSIKYLSPPTDSERVSYAHSTSALQSVQSWFQTARRSMFLLYLLVRVYKFIDLGCVRTDTWWSFWFSTFSS
jgi:hypothetical protein